MNNLKYYRKRAGLTMDELSEMTSIPKCNISRVENDVSDFTGQRWKVLAKVLECSLDELLNFEISQ